MQKDVEQWKSTRVLSDGERRLILWNLGFFSTAESLTANNIVLAVYQHVTNPESRQYMLRQAFEEAIHTDTFIYCCDTLGLDPDEIYNMYIRIPSIAGEGRVRRRADARRCSSPGFTTEGTANIQRFVHDLVGYYVIMEGIFFYAGFAMMLALQASEQDGRHRRAVRVHHARREPAPGLRLRPDQHHPAENPESLDAGVPRRDRAASSSAPSALEQRYAYDACPDGVLGHQRGAVRRTTSSTSPIAGSSASACRSATSRDNPFPWMSQATDLSKEKNFFETRVTEYQTGAALAWD